MLRRPGIVSDLPEDAIGFNSDVADATSIGAEANREIQVRAWLSGNGADIQCWDRIGATVDKLRSR